MKINASKSMSSKKILLVTGSALVILLVAGSLVYIYKFNGNIFGWKATNTPSQSINLDTPTKEQTDAGNNAKTATGDNSSSTATKAGSTGSDQPNTPTAEAGKKADIALSITAANQNGSILQIRSLIGVVVNDGTCTLTLTKSGENNIVKTSGTQALASSSTCKGFDISTTGVASGDWLATLTYEDTNYTGSTTKTITIN